MRWQVEDAQEAYPLTQRLQLLGDLEGDRAAVRVACDGVRTSGLRCADGLHVAVDHLREAAEVAFSSAKAPRPQCIEGPFAHEVLGQIDENQHLTDTRMHTEERRPAPAGL